MAGLSATRRLPATPLPRAGFGRAAIALAGLASLAVAMGIGRFAFTPLLPMMLNDRVIDLAGASWLASANYFGYLVGALLCVAQPWLWSRFEALPPFRTAAWVRGGLVATVLLTLAMALPLRAAWPALRFGAGVASGIVFVFTSGWCLARLAERNAPALGGVIYAGPGAGIVLSGFVSSGMVALHWRAASGWLLFGTLAAVLTALVWPVFRPTAAPPPPAPHPVADAIAGVAAGGKGWRAQMAWLNVAYGIAGFGYIITATFLPVIARQALPGSVWLDFFWPLFGIGVTAGALLATRMHALADLRWLLAGGYLVQAAGIAVTVLVPNLVGFALGSLLVGLPVTAISFFSMQEVRRLRPVRAAPSMGLLTAMYGVGQIAGPQLVALLLGLSASQAAGFTLALEVAAAALLVGAVIHAVMIRAFPAAGVAS